MLTFRMFGSQEFLYSPLRSSPHFDSAPSVNSVLRETRSHTQSDPSSQASIAPLTRLYGTLADNPQTIENPATLGPVFATLTSTVKHKSFVCHSYKKQPGVGVPLVVVFRSLHEAIYATSLESTLPEILASVDSKRLSENLNPLNATLIENGGRACLSERSEESLLVSDAQCRGGLQPVPSGLSGAALHLANSRNRPRRREILRFAQNDNQVRTCGFPGGTSALLRFWIR